MSQISVANVMMHLHMTKETKPDDSMVRHMILNSLRMYNKRYKEEFGEMVLAVDASNNWRRKAFPQYKASRKKDRGKSTFDWNEAFRILNMVREEIAENFPYKVIHIDGCEADDIIGTIVTMNPDRNGDYNPEKIMIVSSDRDFLQLQKYYDANKKNNTHESL